MQTLNCSMCDQVPWPGAETGPPALWVRGLRATGPPGKSPHSQFLTRLVTTASSLTSLLSSNSFLLCCHPSFNKYMKYCARNSFRHSSVKKTTALQNLTCYSLRSVQQNQPALITFRIKVLRQQPISIQRKLKLQRGHWPTTKAWVLKANRHGFKNSNSGLLNLGKELCCKELDTTWWLNNKKTWASHLPALSLGLLTCEGRVPRPSSQSCCRDNRVSAYGARHKGGVCWPGTPDPHNLVSAWLSDTPQTLCSNNYVQVYPIPTLSTLQINTHTHSPVFCFQLLLMSSVRSLTPTHPSRFSSESTFLQEAFSTLCQIVKHLFSVPHSCTTHIVHLPKQDTWE